MNTAITLSQYQFVRASGPDARSFLQGQVSCDTNKITPTVSIPGALCNLKGRVIADFRALQMGDDILLRVHGSLVETVLAVLKKYAVFSKVELSHDTNIAALGLLLRGADSEKSSLSPGLAAVATDIVSTDTVALEFWGSLDAIEAARAALGGDYQSGAIAQWIELEIGSGIAHVSASLSEEYTPALLNYDISGLIDFKKGCYTGQEIVARMFYRSTPKKRLFAVTAQSSLPQPLHALLDDGAELIDSSEQSPVLPLVTGAQSLLAILPVEAPASEYQLRVNGENQARLHASAFDYSRK